MFLRISRFPPSLSLTTQPLHFQRTSTARPQTQSPWCLTPQPNPNSQVTHCLPGIAILLPSPLNVADADVTLTQTPTSNVSSRAGLGGLEPAYRVGSRFVLLPRCWESDAWLWALF